MMAPALGTSGRVAGDIDGLAVWYEFEDLSPFAQGYVEALFASHRQDLGTATYYANDQREWRDAAFSDLAPEALAMILADCDRWIQLYPATGRGTANGARFWELRNLQLITRTDFPPLRVYLNDDGKVSLSQASGEAA